MNRRHMSIIFAGLMLPMPALAQKPEVVLDAGTKPADMSRTTYEFHCGGQSYVIALEKVGENRVRLGRLDFPKGPVPEAERKLALETLGEFVQVIRIDLNCGKDIGYFEITGRKIISRSPAPLSNDNARIFFRDGHIH